MPADADNGGGAELPLHTAAAQGDTAAVRALLAKGADINATCVFVFSGNKERICYPATALAIAIACNHPETMQALLDARAELAPPVHLGDYGPWPLLHVAVECAGSAAVVDVLLATGKFDVNERNQGKPLLHAAIEAMDTGRAPDDALLRRLLAQPGIDIAGVHPENVYGHPLHHAVSFNCHAAVDVLLEVDPDAVHSVRDVYLGEGMYGDLDEDFFEEDRTLEAAQPLHVAAHYGLRDLVGPLVNSCAAVDARCGEGFTPLTLAVFCPDDGEDGGRDTVQNLIALGADVNARREHSEPEKRCPPLWYALRQASGAICMMILESGANPWLAADTPAGLLALATHDPFEDIVNAWKIELLAKAGVNMAEEMHPTTGRPLLLEMATQEFQDTVVALVDAGSDATARDEGGRTALALLMESLGAAGVRAETVVKLVVAGDMSSWDAIPPGFEGLECLIEFMYNEAPEHLGALFSKLPTGSKARMRETLRVLHQLLPGGEGLDHIRFKILTQVFAP